MNKQIIKMAKDLCHARDCHIKDEPTECYHGCKAWVYAERAVNKGYHKASDVAREIFAEIDSMIELLCVMFGHDIIIVGKYAELKKKYESEVK